MAETNGFISFIKKWGISILAVSIAIFFILTSQITINNIASSSSSSTVHNANYNEALNVNLINNEMISGKKQITYAWMKIKVSDLVEFPQKPMFSSFQYLYMKVFWHPSLGDNEIYVGVPVTGTQYTNVTINKKSDAKTNTTKVKLPAWLGL